MAVYEDIFKLSGNVYVPASCHIAEAADEPYTSQPHWHDYIEIIYAKKGTSTVNIAGNIQNLSPGSLLVINSRETHSIYFQPDFGNREFHQIVLKFDPQILYTAGNNAIEYRYVYPFLLSAHDCQRIFSYEENCSSEIPNIMENILSDYTNKTYAYEMRMHMNILRVFIWLLDKWKEANTFLIDNDKFDSAKRFDSLFHHISKNYDTGIGTAQAAKMCYMSYGYFCRLFRNLTGKTFNEYLNSVRLLKAQQLLVSTNSSITDIAYSVGFKDTSYFIRKFKSQTGNTPEKFRQSFKLK